MKQWYEFYSTQDALEKLHQLGGEISESKIVPSMYEAIMQVADDLFLLRDGYTFPIKSREELIHHGYILM